MVRGGDLITRVARLLQNDQRGWRRYASPEQFAGDLGESAGIILIAAGGGQTVGTVLSVRRSPRGAETRSDNLAGRSPG